MTGQRSTERPDRNPWAPWDHDGAAPGADGPLRVYCLPHAGGTAGSYAAWARAHAVPGLRFVPLELPGRGTRFGEPLLTSMTEVVDGVLSVLAARPAEERFLLFGHSMGAHIAYATACRLAAEGRPLPQALVVSGGRPPGAPLPEPLHELDDQGLLEGIVRLGGTPEEILRHPDLVELLLPLMRADLGLLARHAAQVEPVPLPCPVVAFGGADDRRAGPDVIAGWQAVAAGGFRHRTFPGGHFFLHAHPADVISEIAGLTGLTGPTAADRDRAGAPGV